VKRSVIWLRYSQRPYLLLIYRKAGSVPAPCPPRLPQGSSRAQWLRRKSAKDSLSNRELGKSLNGLISAFPRAFATMSANLELHHRLLLPRFPKEGCWLHGSFRLRASPPRSRPRPSSSSSIQPFSTARSNPPPDLSQGEVHVALRRFAFFVY
jgi:hypothetical protein